MTERAFDLKTRITRGEQHYLVSTVLLPTMHSGGQYETMVFPTDAEGEVTNWREQAFDRYPTEEAARAGHEAMVENFQPGEYAALA